MESIPASRLDELTRLRRVRDRIDREHARPLDVEELARGVHMSAGHLSRTFRSAFGESPYGYLMTRRVERAMALLRRGDLTVTEICFTVGAYPAASLEHGPTASIPPNALGRRRYSCAARPAVEAAR